MMGLKWIYKVSHQNAGDMEIFRFRSIPINELHGHLKKTGHEWVLGVSFRT